MKSRIMNRRDVLKRTSLILGCSITAGTTIAFLNGCQADPGLDWEPTFLDVDNSKLVGVVTDIIIPTTDTPGAKEAKVDRFIDAMMGSWSPENRERFILGLAQFNEKSTLKFNKTFVKCSVEQQTEIVDEMVAEAKKTNPHIFKSLRELTILGYCASEEGATSLLNYDPVPGPFKGCVPFSEVGSTYALKN